MYATAYKLNPMSVMGDIRLQQPKQHSGHPVPAELGPQASQRHPDALLQESAARAQEPAAKLDSLVAAIAFNHVQTN